VSDDWSLSARSESAEETRVLAAAVAGCCRTGDVILLVGALGAGKTVFAQGFAAALGVEGPVTSPTFTLVRQYPCHGPDGIRQLLHADLYRLDRLAEVSDLALSELIEDGGVGVIEWGERGAPVLGESVLEVTLSRPLGNDLDRDSGRADGTDDARLVTVGGRGPAWLARRGVLAAALEPFGVAPAVAEQR